MGRNTGQFNQSGGQNLGEQTYGEVRLFSFIFALNHAIMVCLYRKGMNPYVCFSPSLAFNSVKIFAAGCPFFRVVVF
jgi:hypothetical protein